VKHGTWQARGQWESLATYKGIKME